MVMHYILTACPSLHAISVFDKVYKWSPENMHIKSTIKGDLQTIFCFSYLKVYNVITKGMKFKNQ